MRFDYITRHLNEGDVLTTSKSVHGFYSTIHRKGRESVVGEHRDTFPEALISLNHELRLLLVNGES